MKVYIGSKDIKDESYRQIGDPSMIQYLADDAECTVIVLDGVLRKYALGDVARILILCSKKLRINGILKVIDIDFDLLTYIYGRLGDIVKLNESVMNVEMRSFLNSELVLEIVKANAPEIANVQFARNSNIEFDMEFVRK